MNFEDLNLTEQFLYRSAEISKMRNEIELFVRFLAAETLRLTPDRFGRESRFKGHACGWKYVRFSERVEFGCYLPDQYGNLLGLSSFRFRSDRGVEPPFYSHVVREVRRALPVLTDGMVAEVSGLEKVLQEFIKNS